MPRAPALKRRFDGTKEHEHRLGVPVISLLDSDDDTPSVPLSKRQKSQTPTANGLEHRRVLPESRSHSENAKTLRRAPPPAPTSSRAQTRTSPKIDIDLSQDSPTPSDDPERQPITTSLPARNGVQSDPRHTSAFEQMLAAVSSSERKSFRPESRVHATKPLQNDFDLAMHLDHGPFVKSENKKSSVTTKEQDTTTRDRMGQSFSSNAFSIDIPRPASGSKAATSQQAHKPLTKIEVVIDSQPKDILKRFQGPLPKSKAQLKAEKKALLAQLKQSTKIAYEKPDLVERHFGTTGFSTVFSVDEDLEFMRNAASKKNKKADRSSIKLEFESLSGPFNQLSLSKSPIHPARAARDILVSRFEERVNPPLTFSNDINDRRLPGKFQFIDHYIITPKVKMAPPSTNWGCACTDCALSACKCLTKEVEGRETQVEIYVRRPDGIVVLSDDFIVHHQEKNQDRQEITECNEHCRCGDHCWNRVVSKGRTVPLEIFQTEQCGFGVRSSQDIVKGQFIERYLGEIITEAELKRREDVAEEHQASYVFSLDWFSRLDNKEPYHVDGEYFGTAMRFVNHSCNPNTVCVPVQTHTGDRRVYDLAFFAIRDIKAGGEIRVSYEPEAASDEEEQISEDLVKCHCGEDNCRGILWTPGVKTRRKKRRQG